MSSPPLDNKCLISESKTLKRGDIQNLFKTLIGNY